MKRIYKGSDLEFNLTVNKLPIDLNSINTIQFSFFTCDPSNYIHKSKEDIKDGKIKLEWEELSQLEEGVLYYGYKYDNNSVDCVDKEITQFYIVSGKEEIIDPERLKWGNIKGKIEQQTDLVGYIDDQKTTINENISTKQDQLISGDNISTINGQDITKGGDIEIKGGVGKKDENTVIPPELGVPEDKKDLLKGEIFNFTEDLNFQGQIIPRNKATGMCSHAEGANATAIGDYSHAEGINIVASGHTSHAEGTGTKAQGTSSHAEGHGTKASNSYSHSEGFATESSGQCSHAEGSDTTASGWTSHAEGHGTKANGAYSHAEGNGTVANNEAEHAEGQFNKSNTNTTSSIGIGSSDEDRKNAFEVMNDGKVYVHGIGDFDGTNPSDTNSLQSVLNNTKQEKLVSGTNIKSINGNSILQSGNLVINQIYIGDNAPTDPSVIIWLDTSEHLHDSEGRLQYRVKVRVNPNIDNTYTEASRIS